MRTFTVPSLILAAVWTLSSLLFAQTAPDISLPPGDAVRGKTVFESSKANCLSCHRVNGSGSRFGPDLSAISAPPRGGGGGGGRGAGGAAPAAAAPAPARGAAPAFGGDAVANAAIGAPALPARGAAAGAPAATPDPQQQLAQSILDPNAIVSVQNRYVQLTMKDGKKISGKLLSVDTFAYQIFDSNEKLANVAKENVREMTMNSPMPSYRDKLTAQELSDVVSYLMTLKGQ
jgi:mono/diheme cytochrome c family protein/small nuclear ribonucleoprotein (snRNP)-like protein